MEAGAYDTNLAIYSRPEVAAHYAALDYVSPCERLLFDRYVQSGTRVLEIGVGGGRTSGYLAQRASTYTGVDYSAEMIAACRRRYPGLSFEQVDAIDLSCFPDGCFDAVVFAFNGIDYLAADARARCLAECRRVLSTGGVLIFSSHNPRAILVRPSWNRERVRAIAASVGSSTLGLCAHAVLTVAAVLRATVRAVWATVRRTVQRVPTRAFWQGEGTILDSVHGGLFTRCAIREKVVGEVQRAGLSVREVRGDDYPATSGTYFTGWYYYVCSKP